MPVNADPYDDAVFLVRNRTHLRVVGYIREHPGAYVSDILDGTDTPRGSLGRLLRALVELDVLTIDVPPEKRGTGRNFRYTVNESRVRELLAALHAELLGE
jgi:DNA-binding transcriptional ArsR family regulator